MMKRSTNPEDWLDKPVEVLKLPSRAWYVLNAAGCRKIRDVLMLKGSDFLHHYNVGKKTLQTLTDRLAELGLRLGMLPGPGVVEEMFDELSPGWVVVREERPDKAWGVVVKGSCGKEDFEGKYEEVFGVGDWVAYHPGRKVELAPGLFAVPCDDILGILRRDWLDQMEASEKGGR